MTELLFEQLEEVLLQGLRAHPDGLSEYDLLKWLERRVGGLPIGSDTDTRLTLFRRHFILFHLLYRLQDRLHRQAEGSLSISALSIRLGPYSTPGPGLVAHDPLRAYYLDLQELTRTSADEVAELLDGFWRRLEAWQAGRGALEVLGFHDEEPDFATIRRRYRKLCMHHHPDRGGDGETLQAINAAMAQLERVYAR